MNITSSRYASLVARSLVGLALCALTGCGGGAEPDPSLTPDAPRVPEAQSDLTIDLSARSGDMIQAFNPTAFEAAVTEAASMKGDAAALPGVKVFTVAAMNHEMNARMARSLRVGEEEITDSGSECAGGEGRACADRFVNKVSGFNRRLATALAPHALRLASVARDLRVGIYTPTHNGVELPGAVTIHGRYGDALVGIVVYR